MNRIIIATLACLSISFGASPAQPGVEPSEKVKQQIQIMSQASQHGGLAARMQRIRLENIQLAENGMREQREDVYNSFPVILGSYSNSADASSVVNLLQTQLFDGPWDPMTMTEHYEEMSYGQYHLSGTVYGWYELSENAAYYEGSQTPPYDNGFIDPPGGVGSFLKESLDLADVEIDFTQYDNDGDDGEPNSGDDDGVVDVTFFVHSGAGGEAGGPPIWSHRWSYSAMWSSPYQTDDIGIDGNPILIDDYIMQPAENSMGGLIEIGVFSHEFGHALGLPDLYDTDYSSDAIGDWCLMAGGAHGAYPAHMSAWCKEMLGWVVPVMVEMNTDTIAFPPVQTNDFVLKVWSDGQPDALGGQGYSHIEDPGREYFLIENRQHLGSDVQLGGTGLLIYHIDNTQWGNWNDTRRLVDLERANGSLSGDGPGIPWPGSTNSMRFDYQTDPSSTAYNGQNTEVALFNIVEGDSAIYASVEVNEAHPHIYVDGYSFTDAGEDGFLSPGESGSLTLDLVNYGVLTGGVMATLVNDNPAFNFSTTEASFPDLGFNTAESSLETFDFTMAADFERGTTSLDFEVTNGINEEIDTVSIDLVIGSPEVAVVDADGSFTGSLDVQSYFTQALEDNDIVYTLWDVAIDGLPAEEWLVGRPNVVWFSGSAGLPLIGPVIDLLSAYQDAGGNLLLTGQDLTDGDEVQAAFLSEYCAAEFVEEQEQNPRYSFGNPEHELMSETDQYRINTIYGANNQTSPDVVSRLSHGTALFQYPRLDYSAGGVTTIQNGYKTIFLAFGFEALAGLEDEGPEVRADLMARFLEWFKLDYVGIDDDAPQVVTTPFIRDLYPNPFNPEVTIRYELPARMDLDLIVYDLSGREVVRLVEGERAAGLHQMQWNGRDHVGNKVSTGVYFCRLQAGETSQTMKMVYLK